MKPQDGEEIDIDFAMVKVTEVFLALDQVLCEWRGLLGELGHRQLKQMLPSLEVPGGPKYLIEIAKALRVHLDEELPVNPIDRRIRLVPKR